MKRLRCTPAQAERLAHLIEECAEVQKIAAKALRHGLDSNNRGRMARTNRQLLGREIGDLGYARRLVTQAFDVEIKDVFAGYVSKARRFPKYQHFQPKGLLEAMARTIPSRGRRRT